MAELDADRNTVSRSGDMRTLLCAAGKKFYKGAIAAVNAAGYATPGATATTIRGLGRCEDYKDNSAGLDGALSVTVMTGTFSFGNSAGADEITRADIGKDCYIVDDQTVALTDGTGTRSIAGKIFDVDENGVWVKFN
jgi:hypothetical protein